MALSEMGRDFKKRWTNLLDTPVMSASACREIYSGYVRRMTLPDPSEEVANVEFIQVFGDEMVKAMIESHAGERHIERGLIERSATKSRESKSRQPWEVIRSFPPGTRVVTDHRCLDARVGTVVGWNTERSICKVKWDKDKENEVAYQEYTWDYLTFYVRKADGDSVS